ncbi:MAG: hypothetical protein QXX77_09820 [Candidatus Methanosuratincola sp.]|jgi:CRISPR/Cas system CSM-associated protein Csm2 small subunit
MAFKASADTLQQGLQMAQREAQRLKQFAQDVSDLISSQNVSANQVLQIMLEFRNSRDVFNRVKQIPGIADYAKAQFADTGYDIVAEFQQMMKVLNDVISWIQTNFPKDANGYLLKDKFDAQGSISARIFTPPQLAPLKALVDTLVASID